MLSFAAILVFVLPVILIFAWLLFRPSRNGAAGVGNALFVSGLICLCLSVVVVSLFYVRRGTLVATASRQATHSAGYVVNKSVGAVNTLRAATDFSGIDPVATKADGAAGLPRATATKDGEMLLLPLSSQVLIDILGEEGALAIESLNASVSPELRQAYAMIPIRTPRTVPSMFNGAVAPSVMKHALSPRGIDILRRAAAEFMLSLPSDGTVADSTVTDDILSGEGSAEDTATPVLDPLLAEAADDSSPHKLADWITNPGEGRVVVQSRMLEPTVPAAEALHSEIVAALLARIAEVTSHEFAGTSGWQKLIDLQVTDNAINDWIVDTDTLVEVVNSVDGDHPMRRTYALVEFPSSIEHQAIIQLRGAVKTNRLVMFSVALGSLWLCAMLLGIAVRTGQSSSSLRKLATLPAMALLIIPCLLLFGAMLKGMIDGEAINFGSSQDRIVCVIDKASD